MGSSDSPAAASTRHATFTAALASASVTHGGSTSSSAPSWDPRAELAALNATFFKHGAPPSHFGAPTDEAVEVGQTIVRRPELCVLGLHRHFLSEASFTVQGVESLLITTDTKCDDQGERVYLFESAKPALRTALASNAAHQRPVRVVRAATATTAALALRAANLPATIGGRRRDCYRYDGLYGVCHLAGDTALDLDFGAGGGVGMHATDASRAASGGAGTSGGVDARPVYLLVRLPNQEPLPPGVGGKLRRPGQLGVRGVGPDGAAGSGAAGAAGAARGGSMHPQHGAAMPRAAEQQAAQCLLGEIAEVPPSRALCQYAEELCVGAGVTVREAYSRLHAAREALLRQLSAKDAYVLAKRSACNQARLRAALHLMVHASDDDPAPRSALGGRKRSREGR